LTNIGAFDLAGVNDQFPSGSETGVGGLLLPEAQIERPIQIFELAAAFHEIRACHDNSIPANQ
jgi:hypothetical protein